MYHDRTVARDDCALMAWTELQAGMNQVVDWIFDNAFAIVGGTILFLLALTLVAWVGKREHQRNARHIEDKDPREGE